MPRYAFFWIIVAAVFSIQAVYGIQYVILFIIWNFFLDCVYFISYTLSLSHVFKAVFKYCIIYI